MYPRNTVKLSLKKGVFSFYFKWTTSLGFFTKPEEFYSWSGRKPQPISPKFPIPHNIFTNFETLKEECYLGITILHNLLELRAHITIPAHMKWKRSNNFELHPLLRPSCSQHGESVGGAKMAPLWLPNPGAW